MNLKTLSVIFGVFALLVVQSMKAEAQIRESVGKGVAEGLGRTWKGPKASFITGILKRKGIQAPAAGRTAQTRTSPRVETEPVKFKPAGDSGVAKSLAEAFGRDPAEENALTEAFHQIKQRYETEVAKEGKSNDLAAAMTFFIAANVAVYNQSELASDSVAEDLYRSLRDSITATPEFAKMSNAEKRQMHDWMVCMAGFVMAGYLDAKQTGDKESLSNFSELADYSMRLVLGIEGSKLKIAGGELSVEDSGSAQLGTAVSGDNKIVGVWSKSASGPSAMPGTIQATQNIMVNQGFVKGQYDSNQMETIPSKPKAGAVTTVPMNSGQAKKAGPIPSTATSLTISPKSSQRTLRNREGAVQKSQNNPLEKADYKWMLHYFEGIGEMNLVLQPQRETARDGTFGGNDLFPNSYLYSQKYQPEWKFE